MMKLLKRNNLLFFWSMLLPVLSCLFLPAHAAGYDPDDTVTRMGTAYYGLRPGQEYVFFLVKDGGKEDADLSPEAVLYMDQASADGEGSVSFLYAPGETGPADTRLRGEGAAVAREITWTLTGDGVLTIYGSGKLPEGEAVPWHSVREHLQTVRITAGITGLGAGAFDGCPGLTRVEFTGDAPEFAPDAFRGVTAAVVYPAGNATWKASVMQDYGGSLTWQQAEGTPAAAVTLSQTRLTMEAAETYRLTATVTPEGTAIIWSSTDDTVASVDATGLVTAKAKGVAQILAVTGDGSGAAASCDVVVTNTLYVTEDVAGLESQHHYGENSGDIWQYTLENAAQLELTFDEQTELEAGADYLHIYDGSGSLVGSYTGRELAGQSVTVPGDTVRLKLASDGAGTAWGFRVTDVRAAHIHSFGDWVQTQAPDCEAPGQEVRSCDCGMEEARTVAALGHRLVTDAAVAATCTKPGLTAGKHCRVCGKVIIAQQEIPQKEHTWKDGSCTACGEKNPGWTPEEPAVSRLAGSNRFDTAFMVADQMKQNLGIEKFDAVIVASGTNFADALSGSYLSAVKNAPILLSFSTKEINNQVKSYIRGNLKPGGTVYILGGTGAVPASMETGLSGFVTKRLKGDDRFGTNLAILAEAGVGDKPVLVCTGLSFADSLSASATGLPILLVWKELTDTQKIFLKNLNGNDLYIIGGESAVSGKMEVQVAEYGVTERVQGRNRFETSIAIAERFFYKPKTAVVAYAWNFPDGLCGGPLAVTMGAPLILTMDHYETRAAEYIQSQNLNSGLILGGEGLISDDAVRTVFALAK